MGSRELNPDLTGSDGAALSSSGEHALLHMQCSGPPALSHYVRQSHTGCRGHAHRLPDSSKKKKRRRLAKRETERYRGRGTNQGHSLQTEPLQRGITETFVTVIEK